MLYGYARVSTTDQSLDLQIGTLTAAGCHVVRAEKKTGTSMKERAELNLLMEFMREGDVLVVTRIDRLARSVMDLQQIVQTLNQKKVALRCIEQPVDTTTPAGKAFFDMLGVFAEFETSLRRERQMEGIAAAKARGVYKGRQNLISRKRVAALHAEGWSAREIAEQMNRSLRGIQHVIKELADGKKRGGRV